MHLRFVFFPNYHKNLVSIVIREKSTFFSPPELGHLRNVLVHNNNIKNFSYAKCDIIEK